jgi:hypothetical protein
MKQHHPSITSMLIDCISSVDLLLLELQDREGSEYHSIRGIPVVSIYPVLDVRDTCIRNDSGGYCNTPAHPPYTCVIIGDFAGRARPERPPPRPPVLRLAWMADTIMDAV